METGIIDRKIAPKYFDAVDLNLELKPYKSFVLDNGVKVYAIDGGAQEVVQIEFVFFAGNWFEQKNIVAATTNYLLKNGTTTKNAFAINEHFEFYGAYLNRQCHSETATLTVHSLSKHLSKLLPVVAEILTESIFPEEELRIYKQNQQQKLEVNLKKCDFVANRMIDAYLYGLQHPYGKYSTLEDYAALNREELVSFYKEYYQQGECMLFVSGKLPTGLDVELNKVFGSLPFNQRKVEQHIIPQTPIQEKKHYLINDEKGVQAAIRIARPFPNRQNPDFIKVQVLNNIFGGYFSSRLMSNIREEKGYTYGIHSYIQNHIHNTALVISTEAGRDVARATIEETYKEMKLLREELVDEDELTTVRNYMMGSLLGDLDGPFQLMGRWKSYILNGLTGEYFKNAVEIIRTISAEELMTLSNKYLQEEDFYELMVV